MGEGLTIDATLTCDVLVIGAGGAGLRAAAHIGEQRPGSKIIALTKVVSPQKSHTTTAQGGMAAVDPKDPADRTIFHMFDTWKGSDCSADQNVIKKVCELGWEEMVWLETHGMHFSRTEEGRIAKRPFGGHMLNFGETKAFRACYEADRTGKGIMDTVWDESLRHGVDFIGQCVATELLMRSGTCIGAIIYRYPEGTFIAILANATIIATGGNTRMYLVSSNCRGNTGDGLVLALNAGLPVMDLEAVQLHPTGIVGPGILASEALRGEGAILRNKDEEPFMERYAPTAKDLAPRDLVSRAIMQEIREGKGLFHEGHNAHHVWLDLRHLPAAVHEKKLQEVCSFFKRFVGVDPQKDLCPVTPTAHYQMGGIPTNEFGEVQKDLQTIVPGLFACGEAAAASLHGLNRLGTNSLLELITMGRVIGERVVEYLKDSQAPGELPSDAGHSIFDQFSTYLASQGTENYAQIRDTLRNLMMEKVGIFRTEKSLLEALEKLKELREKALHIPIGTTSLKANQNLWQIWELNNLISISYVITRSALERKESRGAHFREDYPERSNEYNYHTLAYMSEFDTVTFDKRPIDMSIFEAKGERYELFDFIERKY
ncbi:MAG: FAD-binding protein [Deltaproteobacteria bacterium]|nr:MAG: FAD-binding protein [Deltaproteobacteria bacterium]UCH08348.1 MAG: FAD-binding protein [Deltaproteobacteria bacterium]